MPRKLILKILKIGLLVVAAVLTLVSCGRVPDAQWAKTIPGVYEGNQPGFKEVVDLRTEGSFRHEVFIGGISVLVETGQWWYEKGAILLEPFTTFFEQQTRKNVNEGTRRSQGALFVMRYGAAAERISPSVDFEYCLFRKKPAASRANTNESVGSSR